MNKVMFLLAFSLLCGCAGINTNINTNSRIDVVLDNQPTFALMGVGENELFREETQFFVDWWQDVFETMKVRAKKEVGEDGNTVLTTKEIVFLDRFTVVLVRIYVKFTGGEASLYALVSNKNHSYEVLGIFPVFPESTGMSPIKSQ